MKFGEHLGRSVPRVAAKFRRNLSGRWTDIGD